MPEKKLYLIDSHALIYRAYYALLKNPLTNSAGQPTGAFYGFAGYVLRLLETYDCPYVAAVMDSPTPTFRHQVYAQYKANREEMPDELRSQIPIIRRFIDACNIPTIIQDGLEADDLIANVTLKAVSAGFEVFLVTRDKDLMQLIGPKVTMLAPEGSGILESYDERKVIEKMGVEPLKIADYLALIGDSSDNIPGVPGIGPKSACKILEQAGSVERLLEKPSLLDNPRLRQKIEENLELLSLSKRLAALRTDDPLTFSLGDLARKPFDLAACSSIIHEMECRSLLKSVLFTRQPHIAAAAASAEIVTTAEQCAKLASTIRQRGSCALISLLSGSSPPRMRQIGCAVALDESDIHYVPLEHASGSNCPSSLFSEHLRSVLESSGILKFGHNLKSEIHAARIRGIALQGLAFDCMIAAYVLDPGRRDYGCATLADQLIMQRHDSVEDMIGNGRNRRVCEEIPVEEAARTMGALARSLLIIERKLRPVLVEKKVQPLYDTIEMPLVPVLARMEMQGVGIDLPYLRELSGEYGMRLSAIEAELFEMAGERFNINSPRQIGELLFDRLGLPAPKRTKTGAHATGVEVLEKLAENYPIARRILDYRELQKLLSTYIDALPAEIVPETGRVHTCFNQTIAATGRLSSTEPNLQNIPVRTEDGKRIRNAFVAREGSVLVSADYSQIELRLLAHLSGDPFLKKAFAEDKDIHTQTASAIYGIFPEMVTPEMRRAAKTINFGLMYGMGPLNLSRQIGVTFTEARSFIEAYFRQFPTVKRYMEASVESARRLGYAETMLGRRRYLPDINASNRIVREAAERTAVNTPVQGTAADIIKMAMIDIDREMPSVFPDARMLLQVHDELVFEIPERNADRLRDWVVDAMSGAYELSVPLKVDAGIGRNWNEAH